MLIALWLACAGTPEPEPVPTAAPVVVEPVVAVPIVAEPVVAVPVPAPVPAPVAAEPAAPSGPPAGYELCKPEWRAGGCNRDHKPTCGILGDGSTQTFANPCNACQNAVTGWKDGACP